jgi:hypothetical protein
MSGRMLDKNRDKRKLYPELFTEGAFQDCPYACGFRSSDDTAMNLHIKDHPHRTERVKKDWRAPWMK